MMFASTRIPPAQCGADDCTGCQSVQHNAPNPILVALRDPAWPQNQPTASRAVDMLDALEIQPEDVTESYGATSAHFDHARRVLERIARLTP